MSTVRPLLEPLDRAVKALEGEDSAIELRREVADLQLQISSLCEKVAGQRAYVLIFGPLKSGKSTLMNAIAGSYVSEVSSLPAYPCLVFVSHGNKEEFVVTDYDGKREIYKTTADLDARIDVAHGELAEHIGYAEAAGELFDPQIHYPSAIRRVDVKVRAKNLEESGAVLVDTPGLYTRMRFGYDRMTRDFRNAAACAIFVVKSDTLFLEQVFTEFNQLLELFSRIFLVVNMDTTKRDLGPDGKLTPSLEQKSPEKIIEAFETLAMPTPLKDAAKEGRVRIYPVDLLNAASNSLQGKTGLATGFSEFRDDLHEYLASTDYLVAFLSDSLRRADLLIADTGKLGTSEFTQALRGELHNVDSQRAALLDELQQLDDCLKIDWVPAFDNSTSDLGAVIERSSQDRGAKVARDMSAAIETWMLSSQSLAWLIETVWEPMIADYVTEVRSAAQRCYEQSAYGDHAGLIFDSSIAYFLRTIDVDLSALRLSALRAMTDAPSSIPDIALDVNEIPVRRGMFDIVALRSDAKVREKLFGPSDNPDKQITPRQKSARLGETARMFFNQFLLSFRDEFFVDTVEDTFEVFATKLRDATIRELRAELHDHAPKLRQRVDELELAGSRLRRMLSPLEDLRGACDELRRKVEALSTQFASTDRDVLLQPLQKPTADVDATTPDDAPRRRIRKR